MDLKNILSISGKSGLFKLIKQSHNGLIVESFETKRRIQVFASAQISTLEDIAVFSEGGEIQLKEVFRNIYRKENGGASISHKSSANELKLYFEQILPAYDRDRVYVSDMKRVFKWYNALQAKGLVDLNEDTKDETEESKAEETAE